MTEGRADSTALRVLALGVPIDVDVVGPASAHFQATAARAWSRAARSEGQLAAERLVVWVGDQEPEMPSPDERTICGTDLEHVLESLSTLVTLTAIGARAGEAMLFHAAGLSDPSSGRTLALVAPSGTGKTTAAQRLGQRLGYLSDETVAVERDLTVTPHPKPLSIIRTGRPFKEQVSPDDLGLGPTSPGVLSRVVLLKRDGGDSLRLEDVPLVTSLSELASHTSYLSRVPMPLHRLADVLERTGGLVRARYGEVAQLDPLVDDLLGLA